MSKRTSLSNSMTIHVELTPPRMLEIGGDRFAVLLPFRDTDEDNCHEPHFVRNLPMAANVIHYHLQKHPQDKLVRKVKAFDPLPELLQDWLEVLVLGAPWNTEVRSCLTVPVVDAWGHPLH